MRDLAFTARLNAVSMNADEHAQRLPIAGFVSDYINCFDLSD